MKSYIKNILILVLLTLIVLPFALKRLNVYEGMETNENGVIKYGQSVDLSLIDGITKQSLPLLKILNYADKTSNEEIKAHDQIIITDANDDNKVLVMDNAKNLVMIDMTSEPIPSYTFDNFWIKPDVSRIDDGNYIIKSGDKISISGGPSRNMTSNCGWFGCRVYNPSTGRFGHGGKEDDNVPYTTIKHDPIPEPEPEPEHETPESGTPGSDLETIQNETEIGKPIPENIETVDRIESDEAGSHHYCLGGNLYCKYDDASLNFIETYKFGNTYKNTCSDGNKVICNGILRNEDVNSIKLYEVNDSGEKIENTEVEYKKSTTFSGLTDKLNYTPVNINPTGDYLIYYKPGEDKEYKTDRCALFGPDKCIAGNLKEEGDPESDVSESSCDFSIKCVANYGSKPGDPKCCGQKGQVTHDDKVCPKELPVCSGYKCGEQWGVCKAQ